MNNNFEEKLEQIIKNSKRVWTSSKDYKKLDDISIREIFSMKYEINLKKDENGMPIPGTGRIITNEEKKMIFDYILENNYPLNIKIYNLLLKAYTNGELTIENNVRKSMK